ncbi:MAG: YicC family protein [Deltaproteobacteria bacterium RIFCSPLOWO2_12_FULL_40_28]|nr:MAG: YicC family protein [Deltaproteobacteria bacterium RIFCSPHIGHO2_02_FULL_40_28]OGQ20787.1 MAG: YicC family protein [Deltaproteobacteria bacterium RIFCSPHIGHO2_12_FULL_40_32]OGQ39188.1 MAG: YicC family protein [Deltaproteobacteria bacterium RIFCSPLOWO2_02_FULL_40_36]OGQ54468.1 MAG: YicC family protein [Deltaproteobacteria bacterium RIFCSPLOWO2_12_FULL_40_28]
MTGIGRAELNKGLLHLVCEIKSVNHRFLEVNVKLPSRYQLQEVFLIKQIKKKIKRGKVDIWIGESSPKNNFEFNKKDIKACHHFLKKISKDLGLKEAITLTHIQNGIQSSLVKDRGSPHIQKYLKNLLDQALTALIAMRKKEGIYLKNQLVLCYKNLESLRLQVSLLKEKVNETLHKKISERIQKLLGQQTLDSNRLFQEVVFLVDRSDVSEELVRLESHHNQLKDMFGKVDISGKKIDFIIQELNREWNTIGSKAQDSEVGKLVIEAKGEIEKMREQVQNVE